MSSNTDQLSDGKLILLGNQKFMLLYWVSLDMKGLLQIGFQTLLKIKWKISLGTHLNGMVMMFLTMNQQNYSATI